MPRLINSQAFVLTLLFAGIFIFIAKSSSAGPIGPLDFSTAAFVDDFSDLDVTEGLSIGGAIIGRDLVRNGATYTGSDSVIKWVDLGPIDSFGPALGSFGDDDFIDVVFDEPLLRAGGWIGNQDVLVQFFDVSDLMLGEVFADHQFEPVFAGWEDPSLIKRVRFLDVQSAGQIFVLDRVTSEVPEPTTGSFVALGLAILSVRRRTKRCS